MSNSERKTSLMGEARRDRAGLWHYQYTEAGGGVERAAFDALQNLRYYPLWFWFNDTPCPVHQNDDIASLVSRWMVWKKQIQESPTGLLEALQGLTPGRKSGCGRERFWLSIFGLPWQEATQEQYIKAEESYGFYVKQGYGPVATSSFGVRGVQGRRTYGDIDASMGYDPEFVALANGRK